MNGGAVLKSSGVIRTVVTKLESSVEKYQKKMNQISFQVLLFGVQTYDYNFHHIVFEYSMRTVLLEGAGVSDVSRYNWQGFISVDYSRAYMPHLYFDDGAINELRCIGHQEIVKLN